MCMHACVRGRGWKKILSSSAFSPSLSCAQVFACKGERTEENSFILPSLRASLSLTLFGNVYASKGERMEENYSILPSLPLLLSLLDLSLPCSLACAHREERTEEVCFHPPSLSLIDLLLLSLSPCALSHARVCLQALVESSPPTRLLFLFLFLFFISSFLSLFCKRVLTEESLFSFSLLIYLNSPFTQSFSSSHHLSPRHMLLSLFLSHDKKNFNRTYLSLSLFRTHVEESFFLPHASRCKPSLFSPSSLPCVSSLTGNSLSIYFFSWFVLHA